MIFPGISALRAGCFLSASGLLLLSYFGGRVPASLANLPPPGTPEFPLSLILSRSRFFSLFPCGLASPVPSKSNFDASSLLFGCEFVPSAPSMSAFPFPSALGFVFVFDGLAGVARSPPGDLLPSPFFSATFSCETLRFFRGFSGFSESALSDSEAPALPAPSSWASRASFGCLLFLRSMICFVFSRFSLIASILRC